MSSNRLTLSQQQRLQQTLAPLQVQYVRMLEMSAPEIEEEVMRTLDENPALTLAENSSDSHDDYTDGGPLAHDEQGDSARESADSMQMADYRDEDEIPPAATSGRHTDPLTEILSRADGDTLFRAIMRQLDEQGITSEERTLATVIAGSIDDNGYLTRTPAELVADIAAQEGIITDLPHVTAIIARIRNLDPPGIGATDLRECMLLQLKRLPEDEISRLTTEMVRDYYDLLSRMQFDKIRSAMRLEPGQLERMMQLLRTLNPKPGALLGDTASDTAPRITPDLAVSYDAECGRFSVTIPNSLPALAVEQTFDISDKPAGTNETRRQREARLFVRSRRDEARSFIQVLEMRRRTLLRVMEAIVRLQPEFFATGDRSQLRPMVLRDVAALTGDDLSVISRATAGKYVATDAGIFPLKFFFNERPTDSADTSSEEIMASLRQIIADEDKRSPLSDETLTTLLHQRGYNIARRTVAKYRERAGIPPARLRRGL